jgi:hypothetical protein
MQVKVKNKTYQPIPLVIGDSTVVLPARKTITVEEVSEQMVALKEQGLLQIIKNNN